MKSRLGKFLLGGFVMASSGCRAQSASTPMAEMPNPEQGGMEAVVSWAKARLAAAERSHTYYPSPGFWGGEIVYQIMVDRFANGDTQNDFRLVSAEQRDGERHGYRGLADYHHGGDLKGIRQRLDYLADLGVTALWLTPIFTNASGAYHGYCTSDFTAIDPNYGTEAEFVDLVQAAHGKGIRVILDIVVNHMCDQDTRYQGRHSSEQHWSCARDLQAAEQQSLPSESSQQQLLAFSPNFFSPLKSQYFFNRCGANSQSEMEGDEAPSVFGDFTEAMLDFDTRNYDFQRVYALMMQYWIAKADIDGYRLDAVKHITPDFTAYLSTSLRDYAAKLGKQNFYVVGEVAGPSRTIGLHLGRMNPEGNSKSLRDRLAAPYPERAGSSLAQVAASHKGFPFPGTTGVYDFAHSGIARDVLSNTRASRALDQYFNGDSYYLDLQRSGDPRLNLTLLEIHDWERFLVNFPDRADKARLGLQYLASAPGIPVIYYGLEQGFNGVCPRAFAPGVDRGAMENLCFRASGPTRHPLYRQDMFGSGMFRLGSALPMQARLAYIGPAGGGGQDSVYTDTTHDVYRSARRYNYLRQSCFALRYGGIKWRWSSDDKAGVFAFSRIDQANEAVVVVNSADDARSIPSLKLDRAGLKLVDPMDVGVRLASDGSGLVDFQGLRIEGNSVRIFVEERSLGQRSDYLGTHLCRDIAVKSMRLE